MAAPAAAPSCSQDRCFVVAVEQRPEHAITIWDLSREDCRRCDTCRGPDARSTAAWCSAVVADFDSNQAVVCSEKKCLQLWDLRVLGRPLAETELREKGTLLRAAALGREGARIILGTRSGLLRLYDARGLGGKLTSTLNLYGHLEDVCWTTFNFGVGDFVSRAQAASLSTDGEFLYWSFVDRASFEEPDDALEVSPMMTTRTSQPRGSVTSSTMGSVAVPGSSASARGSAPGVGAGTHLGQRGLGQGVKPLGLPVTGLRCTAGALQAADSEDRMLAITGCIDGTLRFWTRGMVQDPTLDKVDFGCLEGHTDRISALWSDAAAGVVLTGSADRTIRVWQVNDCLSAGYVDFEGPLVGHDATVTTIVGDPLANRAVSGAEDGTLRIWDLGFSEKSISKRKQGGVLSTIKLPAGSADELLVDFHSGLSVAITGEGALNLYDLERCVEIAHLDCQARTRYAVGLGDPRSAASATDALFGMKANPSPPEATENSNNPKPQVGRPGALSGSVGWSYSLI